MSIFYVILVVSWGCIASISKNDSSKASKDAKPLEITVLNNELIVNIPKDLFEKSDSAILYIAERRIGKMIEGQNKIIITSNIPLGRSESKVIYYGGINNSVSRKNITLMSSIIPVVKTPKIVNIFPHDAKSYTQGLIFAGGKLIEGTGLYGKSELKFVDLQTGEKSKSKKLDDIYFGEGITMFNNKIYQLTWMEGKCFVYDSKTLDLEKVFSYSGEGWGLTSDGKFLYMSNGSNKIVVRNPEDFSIVSTIQVFTNKNEVTMLNELEWINGKIWANVYLTDNIVVINPTNGSVEEILDLSQLKKVINLTAETDVLNGIAYDIANNKIFVTGKNWNKLFEIGYE